MPKNLQELVDQKAKLLYAVESRLEKMGEDELHDMVLELHDTAARFLKHHGYRVPRPAPEDEQSTKSGGGGK